MKKRLVEGERIAEWDGIYGESNSRDRALVGISLVGISIVVHAT
jgi:hypothetical protein